jgi:NAD(P)-dependent dehydrogenase (short-subunit alcohol dehydrogenase family)
MEKFKNKVVVITGATSGIGKETAIAFAKEGAKVVITGRREKEGANVAEEITKLGAKCLFVQADVSKESDVKQIVKKTIDAFGEINICFANAGIWGDAKPLLEETSENIDAVIDINVKGVFYTLKNIIPEIVRAGGGSAITTSSVLGIRPSAGSSVYNASKFAVIGLTKTVAQEVGGQKVRVNCVAPGPIDTDMLRDALEENAEEFGKTLPLNRIGNPNEIAQAVMWLASEDSSYVTGQVITVDGGFCAG